MPSFSRDMKVEAYEKLRYHIWKIFTETVDEKINTNNCNQLLLIQTTNLEKINYFKKNTL